MADQYQGDEQDCVDEANEASGPITGLQAGYMWRHADSLPLASVQRGGIQYGVEAVDLDGPVQNSELNQEQEARATALHQARQVLERRGGPFGDRVGTGPATEDIVRVAHYILTGEYVDDVRNVG